MIRSVPALSSRVLTSVHYRGVQVGLAVPGPGCGCGERGRALQPHTQPTPSPERSYSHSLSPAPRQHPQSAPTQPGHPKPPRPLPPPPPTYTPTPTHTFTMRRCNNLHLLQPTQPLACPPPPLDCMSLIAPTFPTDSTSSPATAMPPPPLPLPAGPSQRRPLSPPPHAAGLDPCGLHLPNRYSHHCYSPAWVGSGRSSRVSALPGWPGHGAATAGPLHGTTPEQCVGARAGGLLRDIMVTKKHLKLIFLSCSFEFPCAFKLQLLAKRHK